MCDLCCDLCGKEVSRSKDPSQKTTKGSCGVQGTVAGSVEQRGCRGRPELCSPGVPRS